MADIVEPEWEIVGPSGSSGPPTSNRRFKRVMCNKCRKEKKRCTFQGEALEHGSDWVKGTWCDRCRQLVENQISRDPSMTDCNGSEWMCGRVRPEKMKAATTTPAIPQISSTEESSILSGVMNISMPVEYSARYY